MTKKMSDDRHSMALVRLRTRIADNLKLDHWDSVEVGSKDTHCSWGLCSNDKEQWPNAGDHIFPISFTGTGRIAPRDSDGHMCPMQHTEASTIPGLQAMGCFHKCRVFTPLKRAPIPTRAETLALFDKKISEMGDFKEVCACDDTGTLTCPVGGDKELPCPDCRADDYKAWLLANNPKKRSTISNEERERRFALLKSQMETD